MSDDVSRLTAQLSRLETTFTEWRQESRDMHRDNTGRFDRQDTEMRELRSDVKDVQKDVKRINGNVERHESLLERHARQIRRLFAEALPNVTRVTARSAQGDVEIDIEKRRLTMKDAYLMGSIGLAILSFGCWLMYFVLTALLRWGPQG